LALLLSLLIVAPISTSLADTIKKCQDAEGRWHYGDTAAEECARTGITEINVEGYKVKEQAAPKTEAELDAQRQAEAKAEAEQQAREKQQAEQQRVLTVYETEENLIRARDQRIEYINNTIKLNNEMLTKLAENREQLQGHLNGTKDPKAAEGLNKELAQVDAQIKEYEEHNVAQSKELEQVRARYDAELQLFRAAKGVTPSAPGAETAPAAPPAP